MIIQTLNSEFLIESSAVGSGCVFIYSNNPEELQRFFGSNILENQANSDWKYRTKTCKQDFANALIHLVKEIDYTDFTKFNQVLAWKSTTQKKFEKFILPFFGMKNIFEIYRCFFLHSKIKYCIASIFSI